MGAMVAKITSFTIVCTTVYSDADQWEHQISASLAFVRGIHRGPVNSPHKRSVTRKVFPFDDVIMYQLSSTGCKSMVEVIHHFDVSIMQLKLPILHCFVFVFEIISPHWYDISRWKSDLKDLHYFNPADTDPYLLRDRLWIWQPIQSI